MARVGAEHEEKKEGAEDIFALGNPGDRLDMQGMKGEQGRHKCTRPLSTGHSPQSQEQKNRVGNTNQNADEVVACCFIPKELPMEHVRQPSQWVPIPRIA